MQWYQKRTGPTGTRVRTNRVFKNDDKENMTRPTRTKTRQKPELQQPTRTYSTTLDYIIHITGPTIATSDNKLRAL